MVNAVFMDEEACLRKMRKQVQQIRRSARAPGRLGKDRGDLHRFRVHLKTWRAQLRLLRAIDPAFPYEEIYRPFKRIFTRAGAIRFWHLQAEILADTPGVPEAFGGWYGHYLKRQTRVAERRLRDALGKSDIPKWGDLRAQLQLALRNQAPAAVKAYFEALRQTIGFKSGQLSRRHPERLHEVRKHLKEYHLNRAWVVRLGGIDPGPAVSDSKTADDLLGDWHDLDAASVQLERDLGEEKCPPVLLKAGQDVLQTWKKAERMLWYRVLHALAGEPAGSTQ